MVSIRTGDAVFRTAEDGRIDEWNSSCESLTGIPRGEAEGRYCWEVIAGRDADGGIVCHPGCSIARLAKQGWPVRCTDLHVRTPLGPRRLSISTIVVRGGDGMTVLHPLREALPGPQPRSTGLPQPRLTTRQTEILTLLADGMLVKQIAARLERSETTIRNHVHSILIELGAHSQLEAVARARELGLLQDVRSA
jgi:DNA-binding CsgD family transcriptional regulator